MVSQSFVFCLSANYLARTEVDKGQAFVIRTKNSYQLFLRLRRRPHSSRRGNSPEFICKALWFHRALFFAHRRIISLELRLTKVKPLSFGLKTVINCFYGFAAVLTVLEEIKKLCLGTTQNPPFEVGFCFYLSRTMNCPCGHKLAYAMNCTFGA